MQQTILLALLLFISYDDDLITADTRWCWKLKLPKLLPLSSFLCFRAVSALHQRQESSFNCFWALLVVMHTYIFFRITLDLKYTNAKYQGSKGNNWSEFRKGNFIPVRESSCFGRNTFSPTRIEHLDWMQTAFDRAGAWLRKIKSFAHLFVPVNVVFFLHTCRSCFVCVKDNYFILFFHNNSAVEFGGPRLLAKRGYCFWKFNFKLNGIIYH